MKYLIPLLLLSTQLYADPDPALSDDDDMLYLYRSDKKQDEKISTLEWDVYAIKVQLQNGGIVTQGQIDQIIQRVQQSAPQPSSRPVETYPSAPQWKPPTNEWTDGTGRVRTPPDKGAK